MKQTRCRQVMLRSCKQFVSQHWLARAAFGALWVAACVKIDHIARLPWSCALMPRDQDGNRWREAAAATAKGSSASSCARRCWSAANCQQLNLVDCRVNAGSASSKLVPFGPAENGDGPLNSKVHAHLLTRQGRRYCGTAAGHREWRLALVWHCSPYAGVPSPSCRPGRCGARLHPTRLSPEPSLSPQPRSCVTRHRAQST